MLQDDGDNKWHEIHSSDDLWCLISGDDFDVNEIRSILHNTSGVIVQDNTDTYTYPMPMYAQGKDEVFVGRIRRDESQPNTLNLWIVADNLRKGAATNAVQIAEYLVKHQLV